MIKMPQWLQAQSAEKSLWDGLIHDDYYILRTTADNASKAPSHLIQSDCRV
jgi:hypothetical protein